MSFSQNALERIRDTIKLDPSLPWTETLVVTYPETIEVDVNDDLNRELALCVRFTQPTFDFTHPPSLAQLQAGSPRCPGRQDPRCKAQLPLHSSLRLLR